MRSPHTMQQHLHREILSSILSTLQTRTTAGLTTHLGKIKAHNNSIMANHQADHLANTVADGQPRDATYFRGAHIHLGQWTGPYTTQPDELNPPKTLFYTNIKSDDCTKMHFSRHHHSHALHHHTWRLTRHNHTKWRKFHLPWPMSVPHINIVHTHNGINVGRIQDTPPPLEQNS
jgi:hypothetical protein